MASNAHVRSRDGRGHRRVRPLPIFDFPMGLSVDEVSKSCGEFILPCSNVADLRHMSIIMPVPSKLRDNFHLRPTAARNPRCPAKMPTEASGNGPTGVSVIYDTYEGIGSTDGLSREVRITYAERPAGIASKTRGCGLCS